MKLDPQLQELNHSRTPLTDEGPKELAAFTGLRTLNLDGTQIKDTGLKYLHSLNKLKALSLNSTKVTDAGLKELAALKGLRTLDLASTKITSAGLKDLAELKGLRTLNIGSTTVTDAGMKELRALKGLQTLNIGNTRVTDAGLKELATLKGLQELSLYYTKVTDAGVKELANLRELQELNLYKTNLTDAGLKSLAGLTALRKLDLRQTQITDGCLKTLAGMKGLQELKLSNDSEVTNAGVAELKPRLPDCEDRRIFLIMAAVFPFALQIWVETHVASGKGKKAASWALSLLKPLHPRRPAFQFKMITVAEGVGEFLLMRYQQNATHLIAQILQFLDHHLSAVTVEAAETLIDDDRFNRPMLTAGVLADAERQAHRHAELLAAAQEGHVDRPFTRFAVVRLQFQRLAGGVAIRLAAQLQVQLPSGKTIKHRVGVLHDLPLRLPYKIQLQPVAAEQVRQRPLHRQIAFRLQRFFRNLLALLAVGFQERPLLSRLA